MGLGALTEDARTSGAPGTGREPAGAGARTRVKICGITRVQDARAAAACGADAIGLNFYAPSPRAVGIDQAIAIRQALPPFVTVVGLFVNASGEEIEAAARRVPLDLLQFHGDEPPDECERWGLPYVKAVKVEPGVDLGGEAERYAGAAALLLDTPHEVLWGGSGKTFDWSLVPADIGKPIILAGGLTAANVAQAVARLRPYAVDVSGGVEESPGIKSGVEIAKFIREVDRVTTSERAG